MRWSALRRAVRPAALLLLLCGLVYAAGQAALFWNDQYHWSKPSSSASVILSTGQQTGPPSDIAALVRHGHVRHGGIDLSVSPVHGGWKVSASGRLTLSTSDPLLAAVRGGLTLDDLSFWMVCRTNGTGCRTLDPDPGSPSLLVDQGPTGGQAVVTLQSASIELTALDAQDDWQLTIDYTPSRLGAKGLIDSWAISLTSHGWWVTPVSGTGFAVTTQHANLIEANAQGALPSKMSIGLSLSVANPSPQLGPTTEDVLDAAGVLAAAWAFSYWLGRLARVFPAVSRRRWRAAIVAAVAATAVIYLASAADAVWPEVVLFRPLSTTVPVLAYQERLWFVLPAPTIVCLFALRLEHGRAPGWAALRPVLVMNGVGLCVAALLEPLGAGSSLGWGVLLGGLLCALGVAVAGVAALAVRRLFAKRWAPSAFVVALCATAATVLGVAVSQLGDAFFFGSDPGRWTPLVLLLLVPWPLAAWRAVRVVTSLPRVRVQAWLALASVTVALSLWLLQDSWDLGDPFGAFGPLGTYHGVILPALVLLGLAGTRLVVGGQVFGRVPRSLGPLCVLVLLSAGVLYLGGSIVPDTGWEIACAIGVTGLLADDVFHSPRAGALRRLNRTDARAHARRMRDYVQGGLQQRAQSALIRSARDGLADGSLTPRQLRRRWEALDPRLPGGSQADVQARLRRRALGSAAGQTPADAARQGSAIAFYVAAPWILYVGLLQSLQTHAGLGATFYLFIVRVLRWSLAGAVYGYAYPFLAGRTPVTKALMLLSILLPIELVPVGREFFGLGTVVGITGREVLQLLGLVLAQSLTFCLILGLAWEWWLSHLAGLRWGQVRPFTTLAALRVPAATVLVAAITAIATTLGGSWANALYSPPPAVPASSSAHTGQR